MVIRQYDGNLLRFGPISENLRFDIEKTLYASLSNSNEFKHYSMDRVFSALNNSSFSNKNIYFETFQRTPPYPSSFLKYYEETLKWTMNYISDEASAKLKNWYEKNIIKKEKDSWTYFVEVDLVSLLS